MLVRRSVHHIRDSSWPVHLLRSSPNHSAALFASIAPPALEPEPETEEEADIFASSLLSLFDHFVPSFGGPLQLYHYVSPASISAPEVKLSVRIPPHQQTTIFAHYQWMSGIRMADKIAAGEVEVQGKVVLELGAGTGLPGLLAVRQGAARVSSSPLTRPLRVR